jgi:hypothetical protein
LEGKDWNGYGSWRAQKILRDIGNMIKKWDEGD